MASNFPKLPGYVPTHEQLADGFTKPLDRLKLNAWARDMLLDCEEVDPSNAKAYVARARRLRRAARRAARLGDGDEVDAIAELGAEMDAAEQLDGPEASGEVDTGDKGHAGDASGDGEKLEAVTPEEHDGEALEAYKPAAEQKDDDSRALGWSAPEASSKRVPMT